MVGSAGTGDFGASPPEPRFRRRVLSLSSLVNFMRASELFVLSEMACLTPNSPALSLEDDIFLSPMWYSLENVEADLSLSPFPGAASSSLSVDLLGSGLSARVSVNVCFQ